MNSFIKKSIEDVTKNLIFREYIKDDNLFIATNNFFVSEEVEDNNIEFIRKDFHISNNNNYVEKITPCYENIYVSQDGYRTYTKNISFLDKRYINLIVISNISFDLDETNIYQRDIIKRYINNDKAINEALFDYDGCKNIKTIEIPSKKNKNKKIVLDKIELNKKFLFKINFSESYQNIGILSTLDNKTKIKSNNNLIYV